MKKIDRLGIVFGQRLKTALKEKKMTQPRLAERLGVSRAAISSYVLGRYSPTLDRVDEISRVLEVKAVDLIADDTDRQALAIGRRILADEGLLKWFQAAAERPDLAQVVRNVLNGIDLGPEA